MRAVYGAGHSPGAARRHRCETGAHSIALDDHEVATVTVNTDGSTTISIENKPTEAENGNGGDGNGNGNGVECPPGRRAGLSGQPTTEVFSSCRESTKDMNPRDEYPSASTFRYAGWPH